MKFYLTLLFIASIAAAAAQTGDTQKTKSDKVVPIKKINDVIGHKWSWEHNKNKNKKHWIVIEKDKVVRTNWARDKITWKVAGLREIEIELTYLKKKKKVTLKTTLKWTDDFSSFSAQGLYKPRNYVRGCLLKE